MSHFIVNNDSQKYEPDERADRIIDRELSKGNNYLLVVEPDKYCTFANNLMDRNIPAEVRELFLDMKNKKQRALAKKALIYSFSLGYEY